ncbi:alpha carbonic anhydrase 1, chloroplastic-like [Silene latifolia]|uniref:alpha carbonic anhydrase 1, chloroplastic-like n=1 Tax=Silene latifolia TaxID=37657 RepID=UPI003D7860D7
MASSSITVVLILGLFGIVVASGKGKQWQEDESKEGPVPGFNYGEVDEWGSKDPSFAACSKGDRQSPIDINTYEVVVNNTLETLERDYTVKNATLSTQGTVIGVLFPGRKGGLKIDGKTYKLAQFHFHAPSEHFLNGVQYAAELHQVHTAKDGSRAVVGVLFKHGPPSPYINMMMPQLKELAKTPCPGNHTTWTVITEFKSSFLRKWPRNYYRYHGSLTTPPCDENVLWSVLTEVKTISKEQIEALKAPLCDVNKNNARPTQPLNDRKVFKYELN